MYHIDRPIHEKPRKKDYLPVQNVSTKYLSSKKINESPPEESPPSLKSNEKTIISITTQLF